MRLRTVRLIVGFAFGLLPLAADAQQAGRVYRIGVLSGVPPAALSSRVEAFRQGLLERGWMEGKTIALEYRHVGGQPDRFPAQAADLVRLKVDVIVTTGPAAAVAAKKATSTIPIVMATGGDVVGAGLVASLARPGGNITGLTAISPELSAKRLELLKEAFPGVSRVAVLWNPADPGAALSFRETEIAARALGVQLQSLEVRGPNDFDRAFSAITEKRADALLVVRSPVTNVHQTRIVDFAAKSRLPAMYSRTGSAEAGGLMFYGTDDHDLYRRAATYVDKILKGAKPADLPVEQPTKFELVINLKTAKALGLTIPQSILLRADKVIE
ncbi:MAG: ABC transporter substrate-binding protein [Candidatus Rokubacteria bacterium]|nr:ABC transporter substrate-binding protein [Candidatus Rokubacteria bacterium]